MTRAASHAEAVTPTYGVTLSAKIAADNLTDLGEWIAAAATGLDEAAAREITEAVSRGRKGISMLHQHLRTHPEDATAFRAMLGRVISI
jgi:hypothetical protein